MGKEITLPNWMNVEDISVPQQGDIVHVSGKTYDCFNISRDHVSDVLDVKGVDQSLKSVNRSTVMNKYAAFSPRWWAMASEILTWHLPSSNYRLGDWVGYNHQARSPSIPPLDFSFSETSGDHILNFGVGLPEIDISTVSGLSSVTHIWAIARKGSSSTVVGSDSVELTDTNYTGGYALFAVPIPRQSSSFDFNITIRLGTSGATFSYYFPDHTYKEGTATYVTTDEYLAFAPPLPEMCPYMIEYDDDEYDSSTGNFSYKFRVQGQIPGGGLDYVAVQSIVRMGGSAESITTTVGTYTSNDDGTWTSVSGQYLARPAPEPLYIQHDFNT